MPNNVLNKLKKISNGHCDLVSLFCGAGGMDLGFEKAGFHTLWANEFDKQIGLSFKKNFPQTDFDSRSIVNIKESDIPSTPIGLIGGPPCQSWSEAGAKRGIKDDRGLLFYEYIRVLKHVKPLFFVAENVHGLVHSRNKKAFDKIIKVFNVEGYNVSWKLLKASDYGVAQDRERVFIVGYHKSLGKKFVFPDIISPKPTLKDVIYDLSFFTPGDPKCPVKNHEITLTGYSSMFMSRNRVRSWDESSFTILATDRHIPLHPQAPKMVKVEKDKFAFIKGKEDKYRRFSIRECARIQSFPDSYDIVYTNPRIGYKMIGNAVPVNMAFNIAQQIKKDLSILSKGIK